MEEYMALDKGQKGLWARFKDATWLHFILGLFLIPPFVRWAFYPLISGALVNLFNLAELGGQSLDYSHYMRGMADFYGRWGFNIIFIIFLGILLLYLIYRSKPDLKAWGLHWNRILPGVIFFAVFWMIIYFVFVPVGSLFTGGDSFYIGMPNPPGVTNASLHSFAGLGDMLQYMFFPRAIFAFQGAQVNSVVPGNWIMGILDFVRQWVLNGPVIMFLVFGFFFNWLLSRFSANDIDERHETSALKTTSAIFFATLCVPIYQSIYRAVDAALSYQSVEVQGAEVATKAMGVSTNSLVWLAVFWFVAALLFNLAFLWGYVDRRKAPLSDWGASLSKWLPGTLVFAIGFGLSLVFGAHLGTIENGVVQSGLFGPFSNYFGVFIYTLVCGWIYYRTRNLIIPALVFTSLPWFLNFIQTSPGQFPGMWGTIFAIFITVLCLFAFVEIYRYWAPYLTFDIVYEKVEGTADDAMETKKGE